MENDAIAAVPSTAEPITLPRSNTPEYDTWRKDGTLPTKEAKPAEAPAADTPKEETSVEPVPEPGKGKESRRKPDAEERIRELTAKSKQLERDLEEARKPKEAKADPPPAKAAENSKPKQDDKKPDGNPKYATYEDWLEDLADWKAEQRIAARELEQAQARQLAEVKQKLTEARERYQDYDAKAQPVIKELFSDGISRQVFSVLEDSPVLADLLYTIGGTEESLADFALAARENPSKALRVALLMEQAIVKELEGKKAADRDDTGKFVKKEVEAPAKRGPESASKPPIEIGNRGAGPGDEYAQALSDMEAGKPGATRRLMELENAKDLRARRGA